jgi:hypothetical protein
MKTEAVLSRTDVSQILAAARTEAHSKLAGAQCLD